MTQDAFTRDRIVLKQDGRALLVDIYRMTGIGRIKLQPSAPGCPGVAAIRLHGFPELESVGVRTPDAALTCDQIRAEGMPARLVCRLGQTEIEAIQRKPDYFELTLPPALLESGKLVEIRWVDQWR